MTSFFPVSILKFASLDFESKISKNAGRSWSAKNCAVSALISEYSVSTPTLETKVKCTSFEYDKRLSSEFKSLKGRKALAEKLMKRSKPNRFSLKINDTVGLPQVFLFSKTDGNKVDFCLHRRNIDGRFGDTLVWKQLLW